MIRLATPKDFDAILKMSAEFWTHTQFKEEFEPDAAIGLIELSHSQELLAVVDVDGDIVGFCSAVKAPLMGSTKSLSASELAFWVNPGSRGGTGVKLLRFMEQQAKSQGVKYFNMALMKSSMPEKIEQLYLKMGYTPQETTYTKVI